MSRRQFLGTVATVAAVAAAATVVDGCASSDSRAGTTTITNVSERPDPAAARRVVVVGAGLAGLTAAHDLRTAGWEVVVLEARDRVGGRVHTLYGQQDGVALTDGLHAEAGGESIDDNHDRIQARLAAYGIATERRQADREAKGLARYKGATTSLAGFASAQGGAVGADYARVDVEVSKLAEQHALDPEHPEQADGAAQLDQQSMSAFLDGLALVPEARFLADEAYTSIYATELDRLSMLFVAQQAAVLAGVPDDASETMRIVGGNSRLPVAMAADLGDALTTGTVVTAIRHDADGVTVVAGDREVHAAHVVLAVPPPPLRSVAFDPPLPAALQAAISGLDLGPATKVITQYQTPFWRAAGQSGFSITDLTYRISWDSADSRPSDAGLLTTFTTADNGLALAALVDVDRIASVQAQVEQVYVGGAVQRTGAAATMAWSNEPLTGGGYAAYAPGQLSAFWAPLRDGTGRIHLAGEHMEALAGYMESAVRSGERAAAGIGRP